MPNLDTKDFICTGCFLCSNICPTNAIEIKEDKEGFYQYEIKEDKCISCEKCVNICPKLNHVEKEYDILKCYAAYSKDDEILKQSSSGGLFTELASYILKNNGVVGGACWQDGIIKHILIKKEKDLEKLRGSKYLQSNLGDIFIETKKALDNNKKVLFSGTSCQIGALNNFIKHDNLYTLDIVCHGVPSVKTFWLSLEQRFNKKGMKVNFRSKPNGWLNFEIEYEGIHSISFNKDAWFDKYLNNHFLKKDCYNCPFIDKKRLADISLGDYWGINVTDKDFFKQNDNKGVSVVLINSVKGSDLFKNIKDKLIFKETSTLEAYKYNSRLLNGKYDDIYFKKRIKFYEKLSKNEIIFDDTKVKVQKTTFIRRCINKLKRILKRCFVK